jgi:H+/Cl- antiporter ClcA
MNAHQANRYTQFITPLGGIIALTCFFFPWFTTTNNFRDESGFQFTQSGFAFSVFTPTVFIASVMIVGVGLYMVIRRTPWKSSVPVLISSGIGLAILFAEQLQHTKLNRTFDYRNSAIELGFWGACAGLIIAALGTFLIRAEMEKARSKDSVDVKQLWFIIHAGGIIALFGIFMPWKDLSTIPGHSIMRTGFSLMDWHPLIMFAFVATVVVLVGSLYTLVSGNLRRLRVVVLVSIGIGLWILFHYYWDFYALEIFSQKFRLRKPAFGRSISFGFYLTILGYVVSAFGMFCGWDVLDQEKNKDEQVEVTVE